MARAFQEYIVYRRAHELTLAIYQQTDQFPKSEVFGLTSQMRRSAYSVPMNIAEGSAFEPREFRRFLGIALGSATELEYQLVLAEDLGYLNPAKGQEMRQQLNEVKKMLVAFRQRLNEQSGRLEANS